MPGIYKIGYSLKDPALRADELNSAASPHPFIVEYEVLIDDPFTVEQKTHSFLMEYREGKEWFRCSFDKCVSAIKQCYSGKIYHESFLKKNREEEHQRDKQIEAERRRKENFEKNKQIVEEARQKEIIQQNEIKRKKLEDYSNRLNLYLQEKLQAFKLLYWGFSCFFFLFILSNKMTNGYIFVSIFMVIGMYYLLKNSKTEKLKKEFDNQHQDASSAVNTYNQVVHSESVGTAISQLIDPADSDKWKKCPKCNRMCRFEKNQNLNAQCPKCGAKL